MYSSRRIMAAVHQAETRGYPADQQNNYSVGDDVPPAAQPSAPAGNAAPPANAQQLPPATNNSQTVSNFSQIFPFGAQDWLDPIPDYRNGDLLPLEFQALTALKNRVEREEFAWGWNMLALANDLTGRVDLLLGKGERYRIAEAMGRYEERMRELVGEDSEISSLSQNTFTEPFGVFDRRHPTLGSDSAQVSSSSVSNPDILAWAAGVGWTAANFLGDLGLPAAETEALTEREEPTPRGAEGGPDGDVSRDPEVHRLAHDPPLTEGEGATLAYPQAEIDAMARVIFREPGPIRRGDDPYFAMFIKPFSRPKYDWEGSDIFGYWVRQVEYWQGRVPYGGVQFERDGIVVDGEVYWQLCVEGDFMEWVWNADEPYIGGYIDPRRVQWYREAGLVLRNWDEEQWPMPLEHFIDFS